MKPYFERDGVVLYHGDCREILSTLPKVDLVLTDPPYGIALEEHGRNGHDWKITGDESQEVGQFVMDWAEREGLPTAAFASPMKPWAGKWRQHLVWDKGPAVGGGGDIERLWKMDHEIIQFARTGVINGDRDSSILRFWITQRQLHFHPCQKPIVLMKHLIWKLSWDRDSILDPFAGSGTTLRAAMDLGRKAIGIEIEERYCEICARRLEQKNLKFEGVL